MTVRCPWAQNDPLYIAYHDKEWGMPLHDDQKLFEMLILEGMQAGLSWLTILKKRENFRRAFDNFNAKKIARYSERKIEKLLSNPGIIRNSLKIHAVIKNAKAYLKLKDELGSFDKYLWQFTEGKTIHNSWRTLKQVPASTKQSDLMAKDLKQRGFTFVGTTICYAHMQAIGMVNDHLINCFRYSEIKKM
jgi:DNA-3-methyladenine glycosylase I